MRLRAAVIAWLALFALAALDLLHSPHARACSYAPEPAYRLRGYPENGAVDVPTNVRPIYAVRDEGDPVAGYANTITSDSGEQVQLIATEGGGGWYQAFVVPGGLQPFTHYVFENSYYGAKSQVSFTTGAGPFEGRPTQPDVRIEHYTLDPNNYTSCSPNLTGTCVFFPQVSGTFVELTHFYSGAPYADEYVYLSPRPWFVDIAGVDQGTGYDCLSLRTRTPDGQFSEPTVRCRGDGPLYALHGSEDIGCTPDGLRHAGVVASQHASADGEVPAPGTSVALYNGAEGGCSFGSTRPLKPGSPWAILVAAIAVTRCRRRGSRPFLSARDRVPAEGVAR